MQTVRVTASRGGFCEGADTAATKVTRATGTAAAPHLTLSGGAGGGIRARTVPNPASFWPIQNTCVPEVNMQVSVPCGSRTALLTHSHFRGRYVTLWRPGLLPAEGRGPVSKARGAE